MTQTSNLLSSFTSQNYVSKLVIQEFCKPIFINIFMTNIEYLLRNSDVIVFKKDNWRQRPDVYCLDYYDNYNLYHIILLTNNIGSRFDFLPNKLPINNYIITPKIDTILSLLDNTISTS